MISLTAGEVFSFLPSFEKVLKERLPVRAAHRLSRIAAKLRPELQVFEEQRMKLYRELGEEDKDRPGTLVVKDPVKLAQLREGLDQLRAEKIEIDLEPLSLDMLGEASLEAADLMALEKIIV